MTLHLIDGFTLQRTYSRRPIMQAVAKDEESPRVQRVSNDFIQRRYNIPSFVKHYVDKMFYRP